MMYAMISKGLEKNYVQYNPLMDVIEPITRHTVSFRKKRIGNRDRARYIETHDLHPHPLKRKDDRDIHAVSRLIDPLHGVLGTPSKLGSYIQLKVLPNILHVCIKRGVQKRALYLLAKRIIEQDTNNSTHIQIKRNRRGRFQFKTVFSSSQLKKHNADSLAQEFAKLIKNKKYIYLLVKPNYNMHVSFDEKQLLK